MKKVDSNSSMRKKKIQYGASVFETSKMGHPIKKVGEVLFKNKKGMDYLYKHEKD